MNNPKKICALITDFGTQDYFIGILKGVMKQINPAIEIIDITNDIPSYDTLPASFALEQSYMFFPAGTVFLVVVDPEVGSSRRILLVEFKGRYFIGPDNGVLTPVLQYPDKKVYDLDRKEYFLIDGESTFEARDKMAPAAAYLSAGVEPGRIGTPIDGFWMTDEYYPAYLGKENGVEARVVYIDKFGNIISNVNHPFLIKHLAKLSCSAFKVRVGDVEIKNYFNTYDDAGAGKDAFLLTGSHGNLELAVNQGSAAELLGIGIGDTFLVFFY